ncbi:unnamed protein product [Polarella glacialis]|uniref:Amidoligase enzyme n=1 Tax=Polarella glacialis TaxID=89957 RepID=A0A813JKF9_POLGL|nr:unnamed protein product [Polarella glacialis]
MLHLRHARHRFRPVLHPHPKSRPVGTLPLAACGSTGLWASRRFGIELECYIPNKSRPLDVAQDLAQLAGVHVVTRNPGNESRRTSFSPEGHRYWFSDPKLRSCMTSWVVQEDSSLSDFDVGLPVEISSPELPYHQAADRVRGMSNALQSIDARITRTFGYHVHLDARRTTSDEIQQFAVLFQKQQPLLFAAVPPSRRDNKYCLPLEQRRVLFFQQKPRWFLKRALNPNGKNHAANLPCQGRDCNTIEIRLHSGTVEAWKILLWAKLFLQLFQRVSMGMIRHCSPLQLLNLLVDADVRRHILRRAIHFAGKFPNEDLEELPWLRQAAATSADSRLDWFEYECTSCGDWFPSELKLMKICRTCSTRRSVGGHGVQAIPPRGWPINVCSSCDKLFPSKVLFCGKACECRTCAA